MNNPVVYQRLMDLVLAGLTWEACLMYIDDVKIFAETFGHHLEHLTIAFNHLHQAGLKLKSSKVHILQLRTEFFGFVLSAKVIERYPEKI